MPDDVTAFIAISQEMARMGDPRWNAALVGCSDQLALLEGAMAADNREEIRQAFNALNDRKLTCPQNYLTRH